MEIREINTAEFIKLCDDYFKDATVSDLSMLKDWMNDQQMTGYERHRFFYFVIQSHKYKNFPALAYFVDYYQKFKPASYAGLNTNLTEQNQLEISRWKGFTTKRIIEILVSIHKLTRPLNVGEITFLEKYDRLYSEMRYMQEHDEGKEYIKARIEKFRGTIEDGQRIVPDDGDNKVDDRECRPFSEVR